MPFCSNTWYRVSHWKLMFSFQTLYISNLLIYYFCSVDSHCGTFFFPRFLFWRWFKVHQSTDFNVDFCSLSKITVMRVQARSPAQTAGGQSLLPENFVWWGQWLQETLRTHEDVLVITQRRIRRELSVLQLKPCSSAGLYSWDQMFYFWYGHNLRNK